MRTDGGATFNPIQDQRSRPPSPTPSSKPFAAGHRSTLPCPVSVHGPSVDAWTDSLRSLGPRLLLLEALRPNTRRRRGDLHEFTYLISYIKKL
ncbi:hypothetical protein F511_26661 [Dorcoceras hygrometricum]|uniref:Uncharacterized protein n=1 Tax=Dorcoceras hygrometricum TaxID=472368 RepID=A0A2Z7AWX7_9LAMI|nr:hypothetical protein F511_26661 [Dorcoceras hygrometricum]